MRLATIRTADGTAAGRVSGDDVEVLPFSDVVALLDSGPDWRERALESSRTVVSLADVQFAPLTPRPEKIVCVGVNYRDHIEEVGLTVPAHPTLFAKYHRSLIGAGDDIRLPAASECIDWEIELGVVIGAPLRAASEEDALRAIAGYTIVNDVTARDWQMRTSQFLQGKSFESMTPVGPFLVTPDEVDHARSLRLTCSIDGQVMQSACTSDLVFSAAAILAYVSTFITLVPGDLIATGTPGGVGAARNPPLFLSPGQVLTSCIEGLGEQRNLCVAAERAMEAAR